LAKAAAAAREQRESALMQAGVAPTLARRLANLPELKHATDIVMVADQARRPIADVTRTYFASEAFFQLDRVTGPAGDIAIADYFDRLALDRALDTIGDAERRIATAMVGGAATGAEAVEAWVKPRQAEVERIRAAIHEIVSSGLTLSKLSVAASLLGDLARQ
jgi:glutamate dehydrogenase